MYAITMGPMQNTWACHLIMPLVSDLSMHVRSHGYQTCIHILMHIFIHTYEQYMMTTSSWSATHEWSQWILFRAVSIHVSLTLCASNNDMFVI
jgi:hypothetical protein